MATKLLLLPGLLCDARLWRDVLPWLPTGEVLVADLTRDDSLDAMATRALAQADAAWGAGAGFAVAGLSMGGYAALALWRAARPRISHMALLDTSARADSQEGARRRRAMMALARTGMFRGVTPRLVPLLLHPSRIAGPLAREVMAMAESVGREAYLRQQQAIIGRPDSRAMLAGIDVPTLVGVGEADALTPPHLAEEIVAAIPGAVLARFPGCGHLPCMEDPGAVGRAMAAWLGATRS